MMKLFFAVIVLVAGVFGVRTVEPVYAQARRTCTDLSSLKWDNGRITSARLVAAGRFEPTWATEPVPGETRARALPKEAFSDLPAFCQVMGQVETSRE